LQKGDLLVGTLISIPAPEVAEIMAKAGFDWLFIDTEHGAFDAQGAMTKIIESCLKTGVPLGIFADSAESAAPLIHKGYSTDALHMAQSAKATLKAVQTER
jgi:hypothetical protein